MKVKRMVKRLFAVGTGVAMLGATAMGALAGDLSMYPDSFVDDGTFNGLMVVGASAAAIDTLAVADIASNMFYAGSGSGGTTVSVSGDSWAAASAGDILEFNDSIRDIETYIGGGGEELAALAGSEVSNEKGSATYEQFLYFDTDYSGVVYEEDTDNSELAVYYKIPSSENFARYSLEFTEQLESDVDANAVMEDLEDEVITILGQDFTIVTAKNDTGVPALTLMSGSQGGLLEEGAEQSYTIDGTSYTVTLQSIADYSGTTKAKFIVNGELTQPLADGDTDKLDDGTVLGVTDVTNQNFAGGIRSAEFFIGANKIFLQDAASLQVNDETINDANVIITHTFATGDVSIDDIQVNMTADDDFYIGVGEKLSENPSMDEPQALFTQNWDIEYHGMNIGTGTDAELVPGGGDTEYDLTWTNMNGDTMKLDLMHANTSGLFFGEREGRELVLNKSTGISKNQYFVLNSEDVTSNTADSKSFILQYSSSDACNDTSPKVNFQVMNNGENIERPLTAATGTFDIKLGGTTWNFQNMTTGGCADNFPIVLAAGETDNSIYSNGTQIAHAGGALTIGGERTFEANATGGLAVGLRTLNNGLIVIEDTNTTVHNHTFQPGSANDGSYELGVYFLTDDDDRKDTLTDDEFISVEFGFDSANTEVSAALSSNATRRPRFWVTDPDNSDVTSGYTYFGTWVMETNPSGSPPRYEMTIPETQAEAMVYVTSGATSTSRSAAKGNLMRVAVVDATKLDTEVASASAQNLIVVGGPCVNTVAAELLGSGADCAAGFTPGTARVKWFDQAGGNVAMLVAGYSGDDTRLAGQFLAHRWDELPARGEVFIEGTTWNDATVATSVAVAAPADPVVEDMDDAGDDTEVAG